MTDKVNREESIARIYQFLGKQKNWQTDADANHNGTIVRTEFHSYLMANKNDKTLQWDGLSSKEQDDLISEFWKSIDFNTKGKIGGKNISNKNALDANEINNLQNNIEATQKVEDFMKDKQPPSILSSQGSKWKRTVKESMIYKATQALQNGTIKEITQEWLDGAYQLSAAKTTADLTAAAVIKEKLGDIKGYKMASDRELQSIIDNYIAQLEGNPKDLETVVEEITKIIEAYADTAKTNSAESTEFLAQYGYEADGFLNDLQIAVLKDSMSESIIKYIQENEPGVYTPEYESFIGQVLSSYLDNYLSGKEAADFTSLQDFNAAEFAETAQYKALIKVIKDDQEQIRTAREELNTYVAKILAEKNEAKTRAVEENVGSTVPDEIRKIIYEDLKTLADIDKVKKALEAAIDKINKKLPDDFLSAVPSTISSVQGGAFSIQLPTNYGTAYQTGELHYKETSGCSALSVSDTGSISLNTSTPGSWFATIEVRDKDGNVVSGPKTITINIVQKLDMSEQNATFNGKTMAQLMANGKDAIQLSAFKTWDAAKIAAKSSLKNYVNSIKSALSGKQGIDSNRLEIAAQRTILYYNALIDQVEDRLYSSDEGMQEITFAYSDENGNMRTETTSYSQKTREFEKHAGRTNEGAANIDQNSSGLRMNESYSWTNTYEYYLNSAVLLKKFEQFYNM